MDSQDEIPAAVPSMAFTHTPTWMFTFRDPSIQRQYDLYRIKDISFRVVCLIMIVATILQMYFAVTSQSSRFEELLMALRCIRCVFLIPGWVFVYRIYAIVYRKPEDDFHFSVVSTPFLADATIFTFILTLAITLVIRTYAGECREDEEAYNCNPMDSVAALPQDAVTSVMISLLACQAIFKCHHWIVLFICWLVVLASIIISVIISNADNATFLPLLCIACGIIIYEYERNVLRAFTTLQDLEHSVRTQMQAENERQVIEMRSVEMRHLLGNVAHDLKTPMQSFVMELELVSKMIKRPASQTAEFVSYAACNIRQIVESLQNLTDTNSFMYMVINRAIDFAKSSSDRSLTPNLETINVTKTIQWAIDVVKSKCTVPLMLEPLSGDIHPHIITDKQWLIENILCLISNAAKFTTTGSVAVRCELQLAPTILSVSNSGMTSDDESTPSHTTSSQQDVLLIEVEDTGIGIPEEKRESMFQPFQQTMRMAGGTGLGLYSLRKRVDALKGSCGISDRHDGADGARIWFKIPYRPDTSIAADVTDTKDDNSTLQQDGIEMSLYLNSIDDNDDSTGRIELTLPTPQSISPRNPRLFTLVVDDSVTIRKSVSRVLVNEGLSVDLAENGQMALEMMGLKRYDLVLMDLQMPVMDGLEAVRRLRKQESESGGVYHQKVIGISAYTGEPYCSDAINAGMDGFIEKPFSAQRFFELCEQHEIVFAH